LQTSPLAQGDALAEGLSEVLGGQSVTALQPLSGGASRETWQFNVDGRPLIMHRQRPGAERDMGIEVDVLRAARGGGVPVAEVVEASTDSSKLGAAFIVVRKVQGETIPRKILRDQKFATARSRLTRDCAEALARLHAIDPAAVAGLPASRCSQPNRSL